MARRQNADTQTIRLCFADSTAKNVLGDYTLQAIRLWTDALGPPGNDSDHALVIDYDSSTSNNAPYCYLDGGVPAQPGQHRNWNSAVLEDALVIQNLQVTGNAPPGRTAVGYFRRGGTGCFSGLEQRLLTSLRGSLMSLATYSGLLYEHQRSDNSQYMNFVCENLVDCKTVQEQRSQEQKTMDEPCSDRKTAVIYKFTASEFISAWFDNDGVEWQLLLKPFDVDSIMLYGSDSSASPGAININNAPLVNGFKDKALSTGQPFFPTPANCQLIPRPQKPSDGDVAVIKFLYPWAED